MLLVKFKRLSPLIVFEFHHKTMRVIFAARLVAGAGGRCYKPFEA
jgi:hypothetical protein